MFSREDKGSVWRKKTSILGNLFLVLSRCDHHWIWISVENCVFLSSCVDLPQCGELGIFCLEFFRYRYLIIDMHVKHTAPHGLLWLQLGTWNKVSAVPFSSCLWFSSPAPWQEVAGGLLSPAFCPCFMSSGPQLGRSLSSWKSMIPAISLLWNQANKSCAIPSMNDWPSPIVHIHLSATLCVKEQHALFNFAPE